MQASEVRPVHGDPTAEAAGECDEYCDERCIHHTADVGWDLSWGARINFGQIDTTDPQLAVMLNLSDDAVSNGMVYRRVEPQQVATFGQHLIALAGAPGRDEIMSLIQQYALARIMANASVPTKRGREVDAIVASHERDEREVARLSSEIAAALAKAGLK
jgi:hypothetical protein